MTKKLMLSPMNVRIPNKLTSFQLKLAKLPIDQKVNFCNCSAVEKYVKTETIALVKLPNINPTIRIAIVSFSFWETSKTAIKTKALPKPEAITIP